MSIYYVVDSTNKIQNVIVYDGVYGNYPAAPGHTLISVNNQQSYTLLSPADVIPNDTVQPSLNIGDTYATE